MLKRVRDVMFASRSAQALVRRGAHAGLLPRSVFTRIQPLGPHPVSTPAGNTITYVSDDRDIMARSVIWPSDWEAESLQLFSELARDARWVLDVGAFTGIYSLIAAADSPVARVIAFEPNPQIVGNLRRNLLANRLTDRVVVVGQAVSDKPGRATLTVPDDTTGASIGGEIVGQGIDVDVTTLDLTAGDRPVDLIKLDIEGVEIAALHGANDLLRRCHPHVLVELLTEKAFAAVTSLLAGLGYRTIRHLGPDGPRQVTEVVRQPRYANYHFVRPD